MAPDRTERLIVELVARATPVMRLEPVSVRLLRWLVVAITATAGGVWLLGARHDLAMALGAPDVLTSLGIAALTAVSAGAVALALSVPGASESKWLHRLPAAAAVIWIAMLWQLSRMAGVSMGAMLREPLHIACGIRVIALAVIPTFALFRSVRRGFALDRVTAAAMAALGGAALAAAAVQMVCPIDRPAHILVAHLLPAAAIAVLGALTGGAFAAPSTVSSSSPD